MYLGVDIGGTKTLVAVLDDHGVIVEETKFATPRKYQNFLLELRHALAHFQNKDFRAGGAGAPGTLDRQHGRAIRFGNLPWKNAAIQADVEHIAHCPAVVENDAKLAGLSEAMLLKHSYGRVVYVTISTGVGYALIVDGVIDTNIGDGGGRTMLLEHRGKMTPWEDFASGRAIAERYGKQASDIDDKAIWRRICRDLAQGLIELIAVMQPEVIVFGGGVGAHFGKFGEQLAKAIEAYKIPTVKLPVLRQAQRPEQAVIYGCYDLAKQVYGHGKADS